jgi:hypothetical protein
LERAEVPRAFGFLCDLQAEIRPLILLDLQFVMTNGEDRPATIAPGLRCRKSSRAGRTRALEVSPGAAAQPVLRSMVPVISQPFLSLNAIRQHILTVAGGDSKLRVDTPSVPEQRGGKRQKSGAAWAPGEMQAKLGTVIRSAVPACFQAR